MWLDTGWCGCGMPGWVPGSQGPSGSENLTKQGLDPHAGGGGGQGDRSGVACASATDPSVETQGFQD